MKSSSRDDVRYWHLADIQLAPVHVRLEVGTERRMFAGILDDQFNICVLPTEPHNTRATGSKRYRQDTR